MLQTTIVEGTVFAGYYKNYVLSNNHVLSMTMCAAVHRSLILRKCVGHLLPALHSGMRPPIVHP